MSKSKPTGRKQRRLNWPLLITTVVIVVAGGFGLYAWNRYQVPQLSATFLERADEAEASGDYETAANYLLRYMQAIDPEDLDTSMVVRMAETVAKDATTSSQKFAAIKWYYRAVGVAENNVTLRSQLATLLMETRQFSLADEQASLGIQVDPKNKTCQKVRALSRLGLFRKGRRVSLDSVTKDLANLNRLYPQDVELASTLARIYRELNVPSYEENLGETADRVMDRLIETEPSNYRTYLARHLYRVEYRLANSDADIQKALQLAPHEPRVILAAANSARTQKAFEKALDYYQTLTRVEPKNSNAHLGIGECLLAMGKTNMAIQAWNDGLLQSHLNDLSINIRLADTLITLHRLSDARAALARIDLALQQLASTGNERLRDWAVAAQSLLGAKLNISEQEYNAAIPILRRVAVTTKSQLTQIDDIELSYQAWTLLGHCYWQLRQWEDAAVSYERALSVFPRSITTRVAAAKAWAAVGHLEKAILLSEQAALRQGGSDVALLLLVRLRLQQQLRFPRNDRDWTQFRIVLKLAETRVPDSWELPLLRSSFLFARDGHSAIGQCMELLLEAERSHSDNKDFLSPAVLAYQSLGLDSEADRILAKLESVTNASLASLLVRAELFAYRGKFQDASNILASIVPKTGTENQQLIDGKIKLALWTGNSAQLRNVLELQLETAPRNLQVLSQLTELAMRESDWETLEKWKQRLQDVEGESGSLWRYFEARRILGSKQDLGDSDFQRLWTLHEQLDQIRPWWPGNTLLKALIADRRDEPTAIDTYIATLQQGLRTPEVYKRLVELLHEKGRLVEAEQYVQLMLHEHSPSQSISGLAISTAAQRGQVQLAVELAKKNVQRDAQNAIARVWLAKTLLADNMMTEAEAQLKIAEKLAPDDLLVYSSKFSHFFATYQLDKARDVLTQIERNDRLPNIRKNFVLAQSFQFLKDRPNAKKYFQKILELAPDNVDFLVRYAMFLAPFDTRRAETYAMRAVDVDPTSDSARRALAVVLSRKNDSQSWRRAQQLLDYLPVKSNVVDKRLNAILLLRRGGDKDLEAAEKIFRRLVDESAANADDLQLLAALLERRGNMDAADQQFQSLLKSRFSNSKHLASYVEFLFRHQLSDKANSWLVKLEEQAPNSLSAVRLRSQWFLSKNQPERIEPHVARFAKSQLARMENGSDKQRFLLQVAQLFTGLNQPKSAEAWYRKLNEAFPGNEKYLAMHLAKTKQASTALELCIDVLEKDLTASMTVVLAKVLLFGTKSDTIAPSIENILEEAVQRFPEDSELLFYVANVKLKQGNADKAIELYKQLVNSNPKHALAWNNIAALLAEQPNKIDTALKCIDRAIQEAGYTIPILLDTKATVLMQKGEHGAAARILENVVTASNGNDPRFYFHLSIALQRLGKKQQAIEAFRNSVELGLENTFLTLSERQTLKSLREDLL